MAFFIGQKVVRFRGYFNEEPQWKPLGGRIPEIGPAYTIRAINVWPRRTLLRFEEIWNNHLIGIDGYTIEPGFNALAFRPVRTTSIDCFTNMLAPAPKRKRSRVTS